MKLIVGLGNPGERYEKTRHNLGFMVADRLIQNSEFRIQNENLEFRNEGRFKAEVCQLTKDILVAKPQTYMNNSGQAVSLISSYLNILVSDIWVVHDDLDIPFGSIKIKLGGGSAGHKGVESIINALGTDEFWRFRIGSGKWEVGSGKKIDAEDYVLEEFTKDEQKELEKVVEKGAEAIETALEKGIETAMSRFNIR